MQRRIKINRDIEERIKSIDITYTENREEMGSLNLISISENLINKNHDQVVNVIDRIREEFRRQATRDLYFYCWYDAQAGQLRASVVLNAELPFGCRLNKAASKYDIAKDMTSEVASLFSHGILDVYIEKIKSDAKKD